MSKIRVNLRRTADGRLLYYAKHWGEIDANGLSQLALAPWDRRIWDDDGSWFKSPSLREVGSIATTVMSTVASAALLASGIGGFAGAALMALTVAAVSTADDALFGAMDVGFGYRSFGDAAYDVGRSFAVSAATNTLGFALGGLGGVGGIAQTVTGAATKAFGSTIGTVVSQTAMAGVQTAASTLAGSAINAFTLKNGKLDWDNKAFEDGLEGMGRNMLVSMAGAFTTSALTAFNAGEKLAGFNRLQKDGVDKFNGLVGSLAGQGVNYALGGDFTLNLLNLSQFKGEFSSGLLELSFGREGTRMNLGTGGANVSFDTLASAINAKK